MAKDITLKNADGSVIYYPKTVSDLVYDNESGKTIREQLFRIVDGKNSINYEVERDGYIRASDGGYNTGANWEIMKPIHLEKGEKIIVNTLKGPNNVGVINKTTNTPNYYNVLVVGHGATSTDDYYEYTATESCDIVLVRVKASSYFNVYIESNGVLPIIANKVDKDEFTEVKKDIYGETTVLTPTFTEKYYISSSSFVPVNVSIYHYTTEPIHLNKGEIISVVDTFGLPSLVSVFSYLREDGKYEPLVKGIESAGSTYQYKATEEIDVYVCLHRDDNKISILNTDNSIYSRIEALEEGEDPEIAELKPRVENIEGELYGTTRKLDIDYVDGKFVPSNGVDGEFASSEPYHITNPINLLKGDTIYVKLTKAIGTNVATISKYEEGLTRFPTLVKGLGGGVFEYEYTAETNLQLRVSCFSQDDDIYIKYNSEGIKTIVEKLDDEMPSPEQMAKLFGGEVQIDISFPNVGYITYQGRIGDVNAYRYSNPIPLNSGETIKIISSGEYVNLVAVISKYSNGVYTPLVLGGTGIKEFEYTTDAAINIVISTRTAFTESYFKTTPPINNKLDVIEDTLREHEQLLGVDKYRLQLINADNPIARIKETPGLVSAIRTWGFIGDSLASGEIWGVLWDTRDLVAAEVGYAYDTNGNKVVAEGYSISQPIQVSGTYPALYLPKYDSMANYNVYMLSDASGNVSGKVATETNNTDCYTKAQVLKSGNYVVVSYPSELTTIRHKKSYHQDNYDISWGQFLCRMCGSTGFNYSTGGRQAKTILNNSTARDITGILGDPQKQAYIIALGQNDQGYINGVGDSTHYKEMGSAEEGSADLVSPDNPTLHGDSFVGYYSELITKVKNQHKDSLIFLMTCPNADGSRDTISAVIRQIYEHYKNVYPKQIFLLDMNMYGKGLTDDFKLNGLHLNSQGYQLAAYIICTYIDYILRTNVKALNALPLIGTGAV